MRLRLEVAILTGLVLYIWKEKVALQKHIILPYSDPKDNYGREGEGVLLRSGNLLPLDYVGIHSKTQSKGLSGLNHWLQMRVQYMGM